jgi:N-acylneuraminate cytidylyltransferase/CMP-N,N'-diacetyllegionaminic acid synthase
MVNRDHNLAIIPARGGSKGIRRKNIRLFLDKPLIAWTIDVALRSSCCDRVVVSTEDREIAEVAKSLGAEVPFFRPIDLASDTTPTSLVLQHAMNWFAIEEKWKPDSVVLLEPTAPGRKASHIEDAYSLYVSKKADTVVSINQVPHQYDPAKLLILNDDGTVNQLHKGTLSARRQDLKEYWSINGLVYVFRSDLLLNSNPTIWGENIYGFPIPKKYSFDLDDLEDWYIAEAILGKILEEARENRGTRESE